MGTWVIYWYLFWSFLQFCYEADTSCKTWDCTWPYLA